MKKRYSKILLTGLAAVHIYCSKSNFNTEDYQLPFPKHKSYLVLQGNGGSFSHTGAFQYSFDFKMPVGDTITAARAGIVHAIENTYTDGNRTPGQENYIIIRHSDGTYGRYFHLTKNGVFVKPGDKIAKGQFIGLSGNTGFSVQPHLHFDVTTGCAIPAPSCQTIAFDFTGANAARPVTGNIASFQ